MISIVIPYYKIVFLRDTLLSLSNQINKNFHVFIFDDNSKDNPTELLKEFEGKFSFTYHKFNDNLGSVSLVKHWKRCLDLVHDGDWIMILGDDDVLSQNVVQDFYEKETEINALNIDVVRFATEMIDDEDNRTSLVFNHPEVELAVDSLINKLKGLSRSSLSEYFFRKNKFYNYSFKEYPHALFSDDILILEHSSFENIFTVNTSVIQIRKSKVNLSGGLKLDNRHEAILAFYKSLLTEFKAKFNKQQIDYIEYKLEREIFNHKKRSIFVFLIKYYIKSGQFLKFFKLIGVIFTKIPKLLYLELTNKKK